MEKLIGATKLVIEQGDLTQAATRPSSTRQLPLAAEAGSTAPSTGRGPAIMGSAAGLAIVPPQAVITTGARLKAASDPHRGPINRAAPRMRSAGPPVTEAPWNCRPQGLRTIAFP